MSKMFDMGRTLAHGVRYVKYVVHTIQLSPSGKRVRIDLDCYRGSFAGIEMRTVSASHGSCDQIHPGLHVVGAKLVTI